ncbi:MAG: hypothetical protein AAF610_07655 [Pseudomonadota bacterium]
MQARCVWLILVLAALPAGAGDWRGKFGVEARLFANEPLFDTQFEEQVAFSIEPEYFHEWDDGRQRIVFAPFLRVDQRDKERTHSDLREAYWQLSLNSAEIAVGLRRVFWGVTESVHLIDVINQTDFVENIDGEDKLGQPMVSVRWLNDWGTVDLFMLTGFRERTFPGNAGRPRLPLPIDRGATRYESSREDKRVDVALRYSHYFGDFDIGLAHFSGTLREPRFEIGLQPGMGNQITPSLFLIPNYDRLEQTSLDLQATKGAMLWKLELLSRHNFDGRSTAFVAGFEYTLSGVFDSAVDLGLIAEYVFDDQPITRTSFTNDIALGGRVAFNDVQDTELLTFALIDADTQTSLVSVEGSRRFGQSWRLSLEGRLFLNPDPQDFLFGLRDDDYVQLTLERFF